jgi:hypothetical protein
MYVWQLPEQRLRLQGRSQRRLSVRAGVRLRNAVPLRRLRLLQPCEVRVNDPAKRAPHTSGGARSGAFDACSSGTGIPPPDLLLLCASTGYPDAGRSLTRAARQRDPRSERHTMIREKDSRGWTVRPRLRGWLLGLTASTLAFLAEGAAFGQTWPGGRSGPSLRDIVAVDRTGEPGWPYGAEDVAQDGLGRFLVPEQSIDIRSGYADTDNTRLWFRVYVSAVVAPTNAVTAFLFIDSDLSTTTGGSAAATALDARLVNDDSGGGYDYVVAIQGPNTVVGFWQWVALPPGYGSLPAAAIARTTVETGTDDDPLLLNGRIHGYLQGTVDLADVGLTELCQARFLLRTVSDSPGLGNGDLDVGSAGPCRPVDANGDNVPDVLLPTQTVPGWRCQANTDCPGGGICVGGRCVLAPPCNTTADCGAGEVCNPSGQCVAVGGNPCAGNADCAPLVCVNGACAACSTAGAACPNGQVCAPDGRCIDASGVGATGDAGLYLAPGEAIRGGAGTCSLRRPGTGWLSAGILLSLGAFAITRRRRSGGRRGSP